MSEGRKYDNGKLRFDLVPIEELEELVRVYTEGAKKYDDNNWQKVDKAESRYFAALLRHACKWRKGEKIDSEFGTHHMAHVAWNALSLMWFDRNSPTKKLDFSIAYDLIEPKEKRRPKILVDMDNVLADWIGEILKMAGKPPEYVQELTKFELEGDLKRVFEECHGETLYRNLPVIEGAQEGMRQLASIGDVFVVTACPIWKNGDNIYKAKADWLDEHFPWVGSKKMVIAHDKHVIDGDVLIDDAMHNVDPFLEERPNRLALVLRYPWNDDAKDLTACKTFANGGAAVWHSDWLSIVHEMQARYA